jgi:hypothetical protein
MALLKSTFLLFLFLCQGVASQTREGIDWNYEIDLLARELSERHPDLFFKTDSAWFFDHMKEVASEAPGKDVFQVAVRLQQIIASMGDAQTLVNYHFLINKDEMLPVKFYWFEEGIYVMKTNRMYEGLLGGKLIAINQISIDVVIDSLSTLLVNDNRSVIKYSIPGMLTWYQLLEYFGFAAHHELNLTVEKSNGQTESLVITLPVEMGEMIELRPGTLPLGWQDQNTFFRDRYFEEDHLYYIQYNRCWSREVEEDFGSGASALFMPSYKKFEKQVVSVLKKQDVEQLVFDVRFNRGGYAAQGTQLISKICKLLPRETDHIFVLIGATTYASAINNTVNFMQSEEVLLVGEETSGKPNYFDEVKRFVLPESGLIISYPTIYVSLLEEDLPTIEPDLHAPPGFEQYLEGIDPAMEAIRNYIKP